MAIIEKSTPPISAAFSVQLTKLDPTTQIPNPQTIKDLGDALFGIARAVELGAPWADAQLQQLELAKAAFLAVTGQMRRAGMRVEPRVLT